MESTVYKQILAEGEARGRAEGRAEMCKESLIKYLRSQLPRLAETFVPRLDRLSPDEVETLHQRVLEAPLARVEQLLRATFPAPG